MDASTLHIRRLAKAAGPERDQAALMMSEVFDENPLFQSAFPQSDVRRVALQALFHALLDDAARFGCVDAAFTDRIVGILLWYPPGGYPMPMSRALRGLPQYLQIVANSPSGVFKLYRAQAALDRVRPEQPHCHGHFMGGRAGARITALLGRRMLDEADAHDWPIYLETQERRAVNLYLRLGFEVLKSVETLPGGPPTWTMWRAPHAKAPARHVDAA